MPLPATAGGGFAFGVQLAANLAAICLRGDSICPQTHECPVLFFELADRGGAFSGMEIKMVKDRCSAEQLADTGE